MRVGALGSCVWVRLRVLVRAGAGAPARKSTCSLLQACAVARVRICVACAHRRAAASAASAASALVAPRKWSRASAA
eukprot:1502752-Pleurochrysis_carterae.AAC.1